MQEGIGEVRIRIPRIISKGEIIRVQALIKHPMETGLREDKKTKEVIPAHYIHDISIYYGETMITHCELDNRYQCRPTYNILSEG